VNRSRAPGFTLIEVLVALVIVAVGMAAVMSALSSSANTLSFLRDETFAQWLALNQIATLRLSGQQPAVGNTSGDSDFAGRSWHWRQEVVTTDVPGVVRIDMKVRPKEVKAGDDEAWTTTVSGIYGNSIGRADGYSPNWGAQSPRYVANPNGTPNGTGIGALGSNTGTSMQMAPPTQGSGLGSPDSGLGSTTTLDSGLDSTQTTNPPPPTPTPESQQ
jgi:general secretion pathway protein I